MKKDLIFLHYLPCAFFILSAAGMLWGAFNYSAIVLLLIFAGLLFTRNKIARVAVGGLMMAVSIYMFLALADQANDMREAGKEISQLVTGGCLILGGSLVMSILLLIPLDRPQPAVHFYKR